MDPLDSIESIESIEVLNDETNNSIEVSDEDIYSLTEESDDDVGSSIDTDEANKYSIVVSYRDADISSDDDSNEERLKIRKEFEEADKLIPKLAATAYPDSHPEADGNNEY
ncbi:7816_t:CDS:2 [Gigaspora margarita]|uniref:7816_t:CDS:1 n=1 Tax=Gigaspora margarita TaxID=4874 RepID=A0ABN7VVS5_GIGMA|nr:7816_t:CDS:2 [Gigaspora margarita]